MAEFRVHNVRFYDFEPQAIQCMDYEDETSRLALARADGCIEIWNCKERPFLQLVIPAFEEEKSIEGLALCNERLFTVGLHGSILEYDLTHCTVKSRTAVTGGPTWCIALSPDKQMLATGSEEGYVCIFDVHNERIMYNRTLEKQEGRILSISWHSSGDYIVTGSINYLRLWSLKGGRVTRCSIAHGKNQEVIVWCVTILDDMTIVSGDSRGTVSFWNSTLGILIDSVKTHKADILCLAVAKDQSYVSVAGVDPTITRVCQARTGSKIGKKSRWIPTIKFRNHSHDVRALALSQDGKLYSGGVDTVLAITSHPPKVVLKIPAPLYPGYVSVGAQAESVLLRYREKVELWRLGKPSEVKSKGNYLPIAEDRVKMLELHCNEEDSIQSCALSPKGLWIAYIVKQTIKIFQFFPPSLDSQVSIRRVRAMGKEIEKSRRLLWLTEGKLASLTVIGTIEIITISDLEASVEHVLKPKDSVVNIACSHDGTILITANIRHNVTAYDLSKGIDITLPNYKSPVTAIGICPSSKNVVVVYADAMIKEYSLINKKYTNFSREFLTKSTPELLRNNSVIYNVSFDSENGSLILFHDDSSIIVLDKMGKVSEPEPQQKKKFSRRGSLPKDMNESKDSTSVEMLGKFSFVQRSHQVLHFSQMKDNSVISVELDPIQVHDRLPPPLKVKKYGGV